MLKHLQITLCLAIGLLLNATAFSAEGDKKLTINQELNIQAKYSGFIQAIALMRGWTPTIKDEQGATIDNPVSAVEYIQGFLSPLYCEYLKSIVENDLRAYYGLSQDAVIKQALSDFDQSCNCTVVLTDNP